MTSPDTLWEEVGQPDMTFIVHNLKDHKISNVNLSINQHGQVETKGNRNALSDKFQGKTVIH